MHTTSVYGIQECSTISKKVQFGVVVLIVSKAKSMFFYKKKKKFARSVVFWKDLQIYCPSHTYAVILLCILKGKIDILI